MRKFVKAYDCSNSAERPDHRSESFGPKENDIMRGLKKYAATFGYEFVNSHLEADIIITNDVFPKYVLKEDKPLVKRMDGVFWDKKFIDRNEPLNRSAMIADRVIFISEYSRKSFEALYGYCHQRARVILNTVDESIFFHRPKREPNKHFTWISSATNWAREEKRFDDMMKFADFVMGENATLVLIGECDKKLCLEHRNVIPVGYFHSEQDTNDILNSANAFINLSYRDAAPKTVCQAVNCKLPVLYANSGGTPELVRIGIEIPDNCDMVFEDFTPALDLNDMIKTHRKFMKYYGKMVGKIQARLDRSYMEMLGMYFRVMDDTILDWEGGNERG